MMDLQAESAKLEEALANAAAEWREQLRKTNEEIAEYDVVLTDKESRTDRSENATFQIASDGKSAKLAIKQMLTEKINAYENHKESYTSTGVVRVGSTVALSTDGESLVAKIVPKGLSDALKGLIDVESPVGKASIGKCAGSTFAIKTRKGKILYTIEGVY